MADERISLYFTPQNDGDYLIGLPARDLTEAEVEEYRQREPVLMRSATTPHPGTGKALYQVSEPTGKRAEAIKANKETVAAGPSSVVNEPDKA
jgi:hypothetical protein